jgi:hypothetical protein
MLKRLVATPVNLYRDVHVCELCPEPYAAIENRRFNEQVQHRLVPLV